MADFESDHEEFPPSTEEFTGASQTSGSSIYLNKFERFKELPTELRLKIWKYASFFQRNVDVLPFTVYDERAMDNKSFMILDVYISSCPAPALLHVCRESRNEGLKYYTADFGTEEPVLLRICGRKKTVPIPTPAIHINWDVDRVCVPSPVYFRDEYADLLPPQEETHSTGLQISSGRKE